MRAWQFLRRVDSTQEQGMCFTSWLECTESSAYRERLCRDIFFLQVTVPDAFHRRLRVRHISLVCVQTTELKFSYRKPASNLPGDLFIGNEGSSRLHITVCIQSGLRVSSSALTWRLTLVESYLIEPQVECVGFVKGKENSVHWNEPSAAASG